MVARFRVKDVKRYMKIARYSDRFFKTKYLVLIMLFLFYTGFIESVLSSDNSNGIKIIGDQEMPKILYILPWKKTTLPIAKKPPADIFIELQYNRCNVSNSKFNVSDSADLSCLFQ